MSDTDGWCTPEWLCDALGSFDLDPCSNANSNVLATRALTLENGDDGLAADWHGSVYVNPPYSAPLAWCRKLAAYTEPWVTLLKLDPTTRWWAVLMATGCQWAPFRRRLSFEGGPLKMTANFPSVLLWNRWRPSDILAPHLWMQVYLAEVP